MGDIFEKSQKQWMKNLWISYKQHNVPGKGNFFGFLVFVGSCRFRVPGESDEKPVVYLQNKEKKICA